MPQLQPTSDRQDAAPRLKRGMILGDRYRLERHQGGGSLVETWLAHDQVLDRGVILRAARSGLLAAHDGASGLAERLRPLSKLQHPNIVGVSDLGEHDSAPYAVMPHVPGGSLRSQIEKSTSSKRPLDIEKVLARIHPIAQALDHMHESGLVHADVRPESILLTQAGALLADAMQGCPDVQVSRHDSALPPGRPAYLAPEQVRGLPAAPASDQYALAVTLFEALSGRTPHRAVQPLAVAVERLAVPPPRLDALRPGIPGPVADALARALDREPEARFPSCAAFVQSVRDGTSPVTSRVTERPRPTTHRAPAEDRARKAPAAAATERSRPPRPRSQARGGTRRGITMVGAAAAVIGAIALPWISMGPMSIKSTTGDLLGVWVIGLAGGALMLAAMRQRGIANLAAWGALGCACYDFFRLLDAAESIEPAGLGLFCALGGALLAVVASAHGGSWLADGE